MLNIVETPNPFHNVKDLKPVKEIQKIIIPGLEHNKAIPHRNGFFYAMTGSGGSGKSSLLMSMFRSKLYYRGVFDNIYYLCPAISFQSVSNHIFADHDKVYHELTCELLDEIYSELADSQPPKKEIKKTKAFEGDSEEEEEEEEEEPKYSCLIIDDFADALKDKAIQKKLNKMCIKLRHLKLAVIITLQSYKYLPLMLRKQLTNISIWKPKSLVEFGGICEDLLGLPKTRTTQLYDYIYDAPYNHLDIDTVNNKAFKNFNLLEITERREK
jgi:hypothetical protein